MRFSEWIGLQEAVQIRFVDGEGDEEAGKGAEYVMDSAGLRWTRDKELLLVAVDSNGEEMEASDVVGAVVYSWTPDHESEHEDHYIYDFDVAVRQDYQAKLMMRVGPQMIDAALRHYKSLSGEVPSSEIRVYAVNPGIVKFLTSPRYGFRIEDELQGGKAILART